MSYEDCERFYLEKQKQAAKVFSERYAGLHAADPPAAVWALENRPELYQKMTAARREANSLWVNGVFDEEFKRQVLEHLRAFLEICRAYADDIRREKSTA